MTSDEKTNDLVSKSQLEENITIDESENISSEIDFNIEFEDDLGPSLQEMLANAAKDVQIENVEKIKKLTKYNDDL